MVGLTRGINAGSTFCGAQPVKLSRLQVSNFRGIKKATLLFPDHVVLIGDNNTGKSTVLEAIDLVLGPDRLSHRSPIDEHDFHIGRYLPPDPTSLKQRHRASHRRIRQIPPQNKLRTRATPLRTVMKTTACLQGRHRPVGFFEARRAYDDAHALRRACRPGSICGHRGKCRIPGRRCGFKVEAGRLPFRRGHLHCLLTNPLYAGRIRHQRRAYEGQHPSIIAPELWDAVQTQLQAGAAKPRRRTTKGRAARSPLAGKLFDETGDRLTPSHTKKKNGQRLRYYVSRRLIQHSGQKDLSGWRLPAPMLEQTVVHLIRQHVDATTFPASLTHAPTMQELASVRRFLDGLCSGSNDDSASAAPLLRLIRRVDISPGSVSILLDRNTFAACLSMGPERIREDAHSASTHRSACVDAASRPSSFWATPRNPSTAHSCAISPTPSPGSTESKQAKPMSRLPPKTPSQRTACARQSAMPSWPPTSSAPLSKVASPLG